MANIVYAKTGLSIPKVMFGRDGFDKGFDDDIRFLINVSYNNPDVQLETDHRYQTTKLEDR